MSSKKYSSEGIVLAKRRYGEADRILVVYTKTHGKVSLLAKGVRKLQSRKRGHLEVFSQIRFSAVKTKSLDLVIEVETINPFNEIREDLKKISVAYFFTEAIGKTTREEESNESLFNLLVKYLQKLETEKKIRSLRKQFILDTLVLQGFWPEGKPMLNPDQTLEEVTEREISSIRVGKKILS